MYLRHVFENRDEAKMVGARAREYVRDKFSWANVYQTMKSRINALWAQKELHSKKILKSRIYSWSARDGTLQMINVIHIIIIIIIIKNN